MHKFETSSRMDTSKLDVHASFFKAFLTLQRMQGATGIRQGTHPLEHHTHQKRENITRDNIAPKVIKLVVPSTHSSSYVRLSSIVFLAAGCATSISCKMEFPPFVNLSRKLEHLTYEKT